MDERVVRTPMEMGQALAEFLRELPARLGRRATVLVPREAIAHELRRQIILLPRGAGLLAGVVFTRPVALAAEICARAGLRLSAGQEQCWAAVLELCIEQNHSALAGLTYYRPEHLREHEGYPRALAEPTLLAWPTWPVYAGCWMKACRTNRKTCSAARPCCVGQPPL
ncbi:MAG: hypothetical protein JRF33_24245 [Deltaproteobacteria bacterium]|nr:hypothetical protein [Deltaproteobacteria bacterium]